MPRHVWKKIPNSGIHWTALTINFTQENKIKFTDGLLLVFLDHIICKVSFIITIFLIYKIIKKYQMLNFKFKLKYKKKTRKETKTKTKNKKQKQKNTCTVVPLNFYLALNYWWNLSSLTLCLAQAGQLACKNEELQKKKKKKQGYIWHAILLQSTPLLQLCSFFDFVSFHFY